MATYSIGELAEKMNLSVHTLRYYDNEGLLPGVQRSPSGRRIFTVRDLVLLNTIECLKTTGMSIKDIKRYIDCCSLGDSTIEERFQLFVDRKKAVEEQIAQLQSTLGTINYKYNFYKRAMETGTAAVCESDREVLVEQILSGKLGGIENTSGQHELNENK